MSAGMVRLLEKLERGFTVLVLLLSTGALLTLRGVQPESGVFTNATQGGDTLARLIWVGVYVVALSLIAARWKRYAYVDLRDKLPLLLMGFLLVVLVGLAFVSILWSASPDDTLRRGIALLGTTIVGVYLATRYSPGELLRLLAWALGIAALLSLLVALALPSYGISSGEHEGAWKGVFDHKNTLGSIMALSALVFLLLGLSGSTYHRLVWASFLGLSVGLLLLSDAKTALVAFLILLVLLPLGNILRWRYTLAVPVLTALVLLGGGAAALLLYNLEFVLSLLGRDPTLTERTGLWAAVLEMIRERPWLGYGYGAFWLGWEGKSAYVWNLYPFGPPHAHNGLLDLWLHLGLLGLLVFVLSFLMSFSRSIIYARYTRKAEGFWPLTCLSFIFLINVSESTILTTNNVFWILYVAVTLSIFVTLGRRLDTGLMNLTRDKNIRRIL